MKLELNALAVVVHPFPDLVQELFTAEIVPREIRLLHKLPLDNELTRDASVVSSRNPEGRLAQHAMPANKRVLNGDRQGMSLGGGMDMTKGCFPSVHCGLK